MRKEQEMQCDELLQRVKDAYSSCRSYRDEGVVMSTIFNFGKTTKRKPFSTRFVRDGGFLFEFRKRRGEEDWDQYAIWSENGVAKTWWSIRNELAPETADNLGNALADATGVSGASAYRIPNLLMPELEGGFLRRRELEASLVEDAEAAAQGFVVVELKLPMGIWRVWIDKTTFLIHRVVEPRHTLRPPPQEMLDKLPDGLSDKEAADLKREMKRMSKEFAKEPIEVESVTTYRPELNIEIDPVEMIFTPPGEATL